MSDGSQDQLHRSRQKATLALVLIGALVWLLTNESVFSPSKPNSTSPARFSSDINRAPDYELQLLPGVGPKTVERIEALRESRGGFEDPKELDAVKGFGKVKMEQLRGKVVVIPDDDS